MVRSFCEERTFFVRGDTYILYREQRELAHCAELQGGKACNAGLKLKAENFSLVSSVWLFNAKAPQNSQNNTLYNKKNRAILVARFAVI